ncbi:MAG: hypothetical protein WCB04_13615 [Mycobacteriales bacterium]
MQPELGGLFKTVETSVAAGRMAEALELIDAAIVGNTEPELHFQRAQISWLLAQFDDARTHLVAAMHGFESLGQIPRAAVAAAWIGELHFDGLGQRMIGRGWLARADRMMQGQPPCVEQGWVDLSVVACSVADVTVLEARSHNALDIARRFGDIDLEARALADTGLALVTLGRVDEGMRRLSESMALVSAGKVSNPDVGGRAMCALFTACDRAGDLARAEEWVAFTRNLTLPSAVSPFVVGHCSSVYGSLLCEVGRWDEAESTLAEGLALAQRTIFMHQLVARSALAVLRIRQGRLDEAEQLLLGLDDRVEALTPLAELYLARGDCDLAAAVVRRALRQLGPDRARGIPLLGLLVEAELGRGDCEAAERAATEMAALAAATGWPTHTAQATVADARVAEATGDTARAVAGLEGALAVLGPDERPLQRGAIHLELARLLAGGTDLARARSEARAAVAVYARAGVPLPESAGSWVRDLAAGGRNGSAAVPSSLVRDGAYWTVRHGADSVRVRDSKGMRYLADLVAHPGLERHVFDLVDIAEGTPPEGGVDRRHLGDAGELIDSQAKAAYRRRLEELREEMEDAEACGNEQRAWQIQAEIDALVAELGRAIGLGGRDRRAASAAEKARLNVTRAIRTAIGRIGEVQPALGRHLDRQVRTGLFCCYQPATATDVTWRVDTRALTAQGLPRTR